MSKNKVERKKQNRVRTSVTLEEKIFNKIREDASCSLRPLTYQIEWIINRHYQEWTVKNAQELEK